jgi:membrane-bound lytic murein transglycosylase D
VFNDAVKYYVVYFTTEKKKVFGNWLKRARRYVPIIKEILKENGMPEDLVYLAMIESGFSPKAYSPKKASGPWQFIYSTGGRFGLRVNYWIDERRDPEKSTVAAAKYLRALFNQFGCWYLAAAGYNAGEGRVGKAIEKYNTNDFWELAKYNALPRETREYIPKLIAAAIIAKDPEKYGFGSITYDDPVRFEEVQMPKGTLLKVIAKANSMDLAYLKSLNPEILRGITPPNLNNYAIKLPSPVNIEDFHKNLEMALSSEKKVKDVATYKVKKKDTLAKILKRYRLEQKDIYLVNDCEEGLKIKPGMVLNIPKFYGPSGKKEVVAKNVHRESTEVKPDKKEKQYKQAQQAKPEKQEQSRTYHIVKKGETLSTISNKYGIDVVSLKIVNNLKNDKVYPNMKLKLVKHVQKKDKKDVKYHIVKKGETLSTISNKYGINVVSLKTANNLKNDTVYPKMKLKIVKEEG